jgi:hypothetical protein
MVAILPNYSTRRRVTRASMGLMQQRHAYIVRAVIVFKAILSHIKSRNAASFSRTSCWEDSSDDVPRFGPRSRSRLLLRTRARLSLSRLRLWSLSRLRLWSLSRLRWSLSRLRWSLSRLRLWSLLLLRLELISGGSGGPCTTRLR